MCPGEEKRKGPRTNIHIGVAYRVIGTLGDIKVGKIVNASLGGLLLETDRKMKPGTTLVLEIKIPGHEEEPLILIGNVVESCESCNRITCDTRLEFLSVAAHDKRLLEQLVTHYPCGEDKGSIEM